MPITHEVAVRAGLLAAASFILRSLAGAISETSNIRSWSLSRFPGIVLSPELEGRGGKEGIRCDAHCFFFGRLPEVFFVENPVRSPPQPFSLAPPPPPLPVHPLFFFSFCTAADGEAIQAILGAKTGQVRRVEVGKDCGLSRVSRIWNAQSIFPPLLPVRPSAGPV